MAFVASFSPGGETPISFRQLSGLAQQAQLRLGDANYRIIGRIRLDRRSELAAQLAAQLPASDVAASDADLCLRAYAAWAEDCLTHLHGDFAFALWDEARGTLFCARDRLGVRTLTYLQQDGVWWVSDSLEELVAASGFAGQALDRTWIADFLKTGFCDDPARTVYADVHRLRPAHTLTIAPDRALTRRYWQLELTEPVFLNSADAYAERFHELLGEAVRDRMPSGPVGIMLSGGLDSSTLAAKAVELTGGSERIATRTWLVDPEIDPENRASWLVAQHLGVAQEVIDSDLLHYDPSWRERPAAEAEPGWVMVYPQAQTADARAMAQQAESWFYGEGPDNALTFEWRAYLKWLLRHQMWWRLTQALCTYFNTKTLREWGTTLGVWSGRKRVIWLTPDLGYIRDPGGVTSVMTEPADSWRPAALESFRGALWPNMLESLDSEYASTAIDWRHPYLDLRVLEFMLATPPIPWGRRKRLIRHAMRGRLPQEILERDKTPLHHDLLADQLRASPPVMPAKGSRIEEFVDLERLPADLAGFCDPYALLRVSILDHWLNTRGG